MESSRLLDHAQRNLPSLPALPVRLTLNHEGLRSPRNVVAFREGRRKRYIRDDDGNYRCIFRDVLKALTLVENNDYLPDKQRHLDSIGRERIGSDEISVAVLHRRRSL